jgi:putative transposase
VRECFALAFVHVATRRVFVSPCTFKPDATWMREQASAFVVHVRETALPAVVLLRDRDCKFTDAFDGTIETAGTRVQNTSFRAPNMNAYAERFVQAIQQECLDKFIAFGTEHMDHLIGEYVEHDHTERPHQAMGTAPLAGGTTDVTAEGEIMWCERLRGVLRHYQRAAA